MMKKEPINRKDTSAFDDSYALAKSVKEIIEKGDTDRETFGRILSENECSEEFLENIASEEKFSEESIRLERAFQENDSELLVKKIEGKTMAIRRKRIALSSAAVAAGIVALFFYLFTIPSNVQQPKANIVTVVERPRIIMEDNSVVELNSDKYVSEKGVLKTEMKNPERHLIVPAGCTFTIELEDRSLITLNAGSELIYPVTFTAEQREVKLKGEGYFKVKKSDLPFIVSSDGLRVKVYGTEFNVCSSSDGITEVVLVSGSVGVNRNKDQIMLKPNEMYQLNNRTKEGIVKKVNAGEMLGWLENNFDYGNISLEQLLSKISAWYGVEFKFENRNSKDVYVDIYASRDGSLDELLTVLEKITGLTFERESNYQYLIK